MRKIELDFQKARDITDEQLNVLLKPSNDLTNRVNEAMRYSAISEGKAFRPFLILTVGEMLRLPLTILKPLAAAVEMIHTYSLIHDDLPAMDNDPIRRGKPSNHMQFDEATAILAGDALLTKGFEVLSALPVSPHKRCQLINRLAQSIGNRGMIGGQMIDLIGEKKVLSFQEILQMQALKTGALITFCCEAPALTALCGLKKQKALTAYGQAIGYLFQITDDLLDVHGNMQKLGKTTQKDLKSHKSTLIAVSGEEKTREILHYFIGQAEESLKIFGTAADPLRELIHFIIHREK